MISVIAKELLKYVIRAQYLHVKKTKVNTRMLFSMPQSGRYMCIGAYIVIIYHILCFIMCLFCMAFSLFYLCGLNVVSCYYKALCNCVLKGAIQIKFIIIIIMFVAQNYQ